MPKVIAVDFDSTIAFDSWPRITKDTKVNSAVVNWIRKRQQMGDKVILWTCRENFGGARFPDYEYKNDAMRFCTRNRLFFHNVLNERVPCGATRTLAKPFGTFIFTFRAYINGFCAFHILSS